MPGESAATAATRTRTAFLSLGGKAVRLSVLTLAEQDQLCEYLRYQYLEETRRQIDGLSGELAQYAWDKAKDKADRIYLGRTEHAEFVFTFKGLAYTLYLAAHTISEDDAARLLLEHEDAAVEVCRKCLGYERTAEGEKPKNAPLPIAEIIHALTNEPYCHTPQEVGGMTLEEIALVWAEADSIETTQADQFRIIADFRRKKELERLGMWGRESIWN